MFFLTLPWQSVMHQGVELEGEFINELLNDYNNYLKFSLVEKTIFMPRVGTQITVLGAITKLGFASFLAPAL